MDNTVNVGIFLINPSGIRLGENASLGDNVSFVGSTATSIEFPGGSFSATNDDSPSLLVNMPTGLQFTGTPGQIRIEGTGHSIFGDSHQRLRSRTTNGMKAQAGQTLALVGGDVLFEGGNLLAEQGRIEVGSVGAGAVVGVSDTLNFDYSGVQSFGDITLGQRSSIDASGVAGGVINVQGGNVRLEDGSAIISFTKGAGAGQDVTVSAANSLTLEGFANGRPSLIGAKDDFLSLATGTNGNVTVNTPQLVIADGAQILTGAFTRGGDAGNLTINADVTDISGVGVLGFGPSGLYATLDNSSTVGNLTVNGDRLTVRDNGVIAMENSGDGRVGTMQLNLSESVTIQSGAEVTANTLLDLGNAGDITLTTAQLALDDGRLLAESTGAGTGGTIAINAGQVTLDNQSEIATTARNLGDAGNINLKASNLTATNVSVIASQVTSGATGNGGVVNLDLSTLSLGGGSQVSVGTFGVGDAGVVNVNVAGTVTIAGTGINAMGKTALSGISSQVNAVEPPAPQATGQGGTVTLKANNLFLREGGNLTTGTAGGGAGGNMTVEVSDTIAISGIGSTGLPSAIAARTRTDQNAGNLNIRTNTLQISDRGTVTVESLGTGNAGNLSIDARYIKLNNNANITGATTSGQGGNLDLDALHIIMLFDSEISTTAGSAGQPGDGGNITIDVATVTGLFNSDIASNSFQGRGGRIVITAEGIFSLAFRLNRTVEDDITAVSLFNPTLNGEVVLNTPGIDPTQALVEVPVVESPEVVERVCNVGIGDRLNDSSYFTFLGSDLPPSPTDAPSVGRIVVQKLKPPTGTDRALDPDRIPALPPSHSARDRLIAQGWGRNAQGQLVLTSQVPTAQPQRLMISAVQC